MADTLDGRDAGPPPDAIGDGINPTIEKFRSNVTRLLNVESNTERERSKSREALAHAGKMAAVGRMVASVNHEIKRPLASMKILVENTSDLIARGKIQDAAENLGLLLRAVEQLSDLSRQLEAFSRKTPLNKTVIELQRAADNARAVLAPKIKEGRHKLEVALNVQHAYADLDRLTLALVNIVDNAMDATAGSDDRLIVITANEEEGDVVIHVRDHGPGIAEEAMDKLFDAFFTTKPEGKGLGLGLALTCEVIADMHGRLSAINHPEGGAEFCIRLPSTGGMQ